MLTLTQYQALKSWPNDSTQNELEKLGLIRPFKHPLTGRIVAMTPNYPDCIDAIRDYEAAQKSSIQADLSDVPEINFGDNPCTGCGTQRCYPEHCDMLREYEAKQKDGE